ncbi:MAG TPA: YqeG family HAD IIIA-type phosphatase [Armatimonadota bacterium]|nr:YqeG family HAD IIIA-type phosphatase [Armatimonadota bacterium]
MLEKLVPNQAVHRLTEVDVDALVERGITTILLDLDNTITSWRSLDVPDDLAAWVEEAKGKCRVCIVSNTSKMQRLDKLKERMDLEAVGFASKPWGFKKAMAKLDVKADEAIAIGDQLMTDVYGGNLAGCETVLVKPVSNDEFFGTYFIRLIERCCLGMLRRRGMFTRPWE